MKIKDIWSVLDEDTRCIIWNRRNGEEFYGYPDEMDEKFMEYRVVKLYPGFQDKEQIMRIRATK